MKHSPGFLPWSRKQRRHSPDRRGRDLGAPRAGETLNLIDIREDNEWERGHLPHATHLGKGIIERDIETTIPDHNAEIVLYCGGGFRSALAADVLQKMGYTNVISMDGGYRGWVEAGHPVEK
jgi:rhodanese-related sulfurtransferase